MRTIQSELITKGYAKSTKDSYPILKKKIKERLSAREWEEIMGCNRNTFSRGKGGAYRQR